MSKITDKQRLNILIELCLDNDIEFNCDFAQMLFFARQKSKTHSAAFRKAIDQWIRDER